MSEENNEQQQWFIDESTPGTGERPSWLPPKFKTVADLAKAHSELEKKLGTVPEKYEFNSKHLDSSYQGFEDLQKFAKDKRVPKEVMDKFVETMDSYVSKTSINPEEEMKRLGENAQERLTVLDNWAKANLSKEGYEAIKNNVKDAPTIKALEELREKTMLNTIQVPTNSNPLTPPPSVDDLKAELAKNIEKYKSDDAYRKDWQSRLDKAAKSSTTYIDKVGA